MGIGTFILGALIGGGAVYWAMKKSGGLLGIIPGLIPGLPRVAVASENPWA